MTAPLARDALKIFLDGDEVPGLIAYGVATPEISQEISFPADAWLAAPEPDSFVLRGDGWHVHGWDIPIVIWPTGSSFETAVQRTLEALIRSGCRVAWIGAEGVPFCDPPELFDPECMSGGVLAWMTDDRRFDCPLNPDRVLTPVSDDDLLRLRAYADGLANTSRDGE